MVLVLKTKFRSSYVLRVAGIYPVHGWKDKDGLVHMAEASSNDNGSVIEWGQMIGEFC